MVKVMISYPAGSNIEDFERLQAGIREGGGEIRRMIPLKEKGRTLGYSIEAWLPGPADHTATLVAA